MSSARALANQKLYHARILIDAWRTALRQEQVASSVLEEAFGEPVCQCLAQAYGWFLLEIAQATDLPSRPPRCCAELPPVPEGREVPPEILEFQQLEKQPWLIQILDPVFGSLRRVRTPERLNVQKNLAVASEQSLTPEETEQWHTQLSELFARMTDSLDEY